MMLEDMLRNHVISQEFYNWLIENGFKTAPASTKYHGAYEGGLYEHSCEVTRDLVYMTEKLGLKWQREESPWIVGMFHDLCKIDAYVNSNPEHFGNCIVYPSVIEYEYNEDILLKGHGEKSVMLLSQFMTLTEEEIMCIRYHMGAYETKDWKQLDLAIKKYPNVLFTHTADMSASKLRA